MTPEAWLLAALFLAAAVLYASVGHAGASAYLAAMALLGVAPDVMRPTALVLNVLVATIVVIRFRRAGFLELRPLLPLVAGSIPMALIGGSIDLPDAAYRPLVALVLLVGAWRLATSAERAGPGEAATPRIPPLAGVAAGAAIGALAGLTGTGGGIFLTPLMVLAGWSGARHAAGLSGAFILANSVSGIAGLLIAGTGTWAPALPLWLGAVFVGGVIGAELGSARYSVLGLRRVLAVVLVVAAAKLVFLP
jgi:uncharacterized membrane protein YfcA